ncbi:uncharacterized protein LOC110465547 [Mizuhopecten yessoensis]|uniref:uncharacterized protein LOC110465547 n=1 Tax=Mizuhopecten yessoensis TaxID=6573 RepID=UPI000B45B48C|nr:uncharacterized protein LOC110465547 [Mizuhopecten yessoensis]
MTLRNPRLSAHVHGLSKDVTDFGGGGKPEYSQKNNQYATCSWQLPHVGHEPATKLWRASDHRRLNYSADAAPNTTAGVICPVVQSTCARPLSEILWDSPLANEIKQRALSTFFVQGISNGCLNPTAFGITKHCFQSGTLKIQQVLSLATPASRTQTTNIRSLLHRTPST